MAIIAIVVASNWFKNRSMGYSDYGNSYSDGFGTSMQLAAATGLATADSRSAISGFFERGSVEDKAAYNQTTPSIAPPRPGNVGVAPEEPDRMVVKTGSLSMVVKDVRNAVSAITKYTLEKNGFVVSSNIGKSGLAPYATVVVRLPVAVFDGGVGDIKNLGEVESENLTGEDVTSQYVDMDARLRNLQATESQLLTIMARAGQIKDVLDVQRELTTVRGQIESLKGQMKYLNDSAQMSSLTIILSTDPNELPVVEKDRNAWKPLAILKDAVRSLKVSLQSAVGSLIWVLVYLPVWILIMVALWLVVKLYRYLRRKFGDKFNQPL